MLMLEDVLRVLSLGLGVAASGALLAGLARRLGPADPERRRAPHFRRAVRLALLALVPGVLAASAVTVPNGQAGVRVSQFSGVRAGTLYPGLHFVRPLVERVALYDVRDRMAGAGGESLHVQSKEGMGIGLALSVRYRLDPERLHTIHATLPQPVEEQLVPPAVASVFRQLVPNYMVREVFADKREEIRQKAAQAIAQRLGSDGIVVKEVVLKDVVLPPEYAKGLEGLLLKQQQNERMVYDLQIKEKEVRAAELEAEARKARDVKQAEASAQVKVLEAKAQADAMQHTLPLKQKQIEQTRLEAEARKAATLSDAEANSQAKVIDARAELERRKLLADADAQRTRVMAAADGERLRLEADVLRENPLLIQKIVAERLSDKMQIMMVPMDGRDFFAADVLRAGLGMGQSAAPAGPGKEPSAPKSTRTASRR